MFPINYIHLLHKRFLKFQKTRGIHGILSSTYNHKVSSLLLPVQPESQKTTDSFTFHPISKLLNKSKLKLSESMTLMLLFYI